MPQFLSVDWLDALGRAAAKSTALHDATERHRLVIEQTVTDGPNGDSRYHVLVDNGAVAVCAGEADAPTLTFSTDYATAVAVNSGAESAQAAFMRGRLRVGGDVRELLRNAEILSMLEDVFAPVRAETSY